MLILPLAFDWTHSVPAQQTSFSSLSSQQHVGINISFVKSCLGICKQELPSVKYYYELFLAGCCLELLLSPATLFYEEIQTKTSTSPKALIKPNM